MIVIIRIETPPLYLSIIKSVYLSVFLIKYLQKIYKFLRWLSWFTPVTALSLIIIMPSSTEALPNRKTATVQKSSAIPRVYSTQYRMHANRCVKLMCVGPVRSRLKKMKQH